LSKNNKHKYPYKASATADLIERKLQIVNDFPDLDSIIRSSLITRSVKCGKASCHCSKGEGHKGLYLSSYYDGHKYIDYVPKRYEEKLAGCVKKFNEVSSLLIEISEINLELFRRRELEL